MTKIEAALRGLITTVNGITAYASADTLHNLSRLASVLNKVELHLDYPIQIHRAYLSEELNAALEAPCDGAFCDGRGAEFTCEAFGSPAKVVKKLRSFHGDFTLIRNEDHRLVSLIIPQVTVRSERQVVV